MARALATGCTARAVDHSPAMVALAREQNRRACSDDRLEVVEASVEALPFAAGEFTAATSMNAFFFFPDPDAVLSEAHRVLAPGGRLVIVTQAPDLPRLVRRSFVGQRMRSYPDDQLRHMCTSAGFVEVEVERLDRHGRANQLGILQVVTAQRPPR